MIFRVFSIFGFVTLFCISASHAALVRSFDTNEWDVELTTKGLCSIKEGFVVSGPLHEIGGLPSGGMWIDKKQIQSIHKPSVRGGNFKALDSNGAFFLDKNGRASMKLFNKSSIDKSNKLIVEEEDKSYQGFKESDMKGMKFAFQNGPILLFDGKIPNEHRALKSDGKDDRKSRAGIGFNSAAPHILKIIFIEDSDDRTGMNFDEFSREIKKHGLTHFIYLDGFVVGYNENGGCQVPDSAKTGSYKIHFKKKTVKVAPVPAICIKEDDLKDDPKGKEEFVKEVSDIMNLPVENMNVDVKFDKDGFAKEIIVKSEGKKVIEQEIVCEGSEKDRYLNSTPEQRERLKNAQKIATDLMKMENEASARGASYWKSKEGTFNYARLASDGIAGVVVGTAGGIIVHNIVKNNQTKSGFEKVRCAIAGGIVADYGDEFNATKK